MKKLAITLAGLIITTIFSIANDSSYMGTGATLAPCHETDIDITRENLTIKFTNSGFAYFTVEYTLFNKGPEKKITMGFETDTYCSHGISPDGNPNMRNFKTFLNGKNIPYKVKLVLSDYQQEIYESTHSYKEIDDCDGGVTYAYSFDAIFPHGESKMMQTFELDPSSSVGIPYTFPYKLTPAVRWGNGIIEDFTLKIDASECFRHFYLSGDQALVKSNWEGPEDLKEKKWKTELETLKLSETYKDPDTGDYVDNMPDKRIDRIIILHNTWIETHIKNYKPTEELTISAFNSYFYTYIPERNFVFGDHFEGGFFIPELNVIEDEDTGESEYENWNFYERVLRVLPFALRGYVPADDPEVLQHLKKIIWYMPDPTYKPSMEGLNEDEIRFVTEGKVFPYEIFN